MKALLGWFTRGPKEQRAVQLISLFSYIVATDLTAITFSCHFLFFIGSTMNRFSNFMENFNQSVLLSPVDDSIKALDDFVCSFRTL